jgi:hypothetical protein
MLNPCNSRKSKQRQEWEWDHRPDSPASQTKARMWKQDHCPDSPAPTKPTCPSQGGSGTIAPTHQPRKQKQGCGSRTIVPTHQPRKAHIPKSRRERDHRPDSPAWKPAKRKKKHAAEGKSKVQCGKEQNKHPTHQLNDKPRLASTSDITLLSCRAAAPAWQQSYPKSRRDLRQRQHGREERSVVENFQQPNLKTRPVADAVTCPR